MKRPNGSGGVRKLSGRRRKPYQAVVPGGYVYDDKGLAHRKQVSLGVFRTKKEALAALADWQALPMNVDHRQMTFRQIYEIVFPTFSKSVQAVMGETAIKRIGPIADMRIVDIKKREIEIIADSVSGMSGSVQARTKRLVSSVFKWALEDDIILKDYSQFMTFTDTKARKEKTALQKNEIEIMLNADEPLWKVMLYTGMRISEAIKMDSEHIYDEKGVLCFHVWDAKTNAGNRIIPVHSSIMNLLESNMYPLVKKKRVDTYNNDFKSLGVPHTSHDLRRTFSTYGKKCGMDDFYRRALLGHAQKNLTDEVYTQPLVEDLKSQIELLHY